MQKTRNQHWIPQFYMREFAVPGYRRKKNAKVWLMDTETAEVEKKKIQEVGASEHLYSHLKVDGTHCYRVEEKLAKLETIIARIYPRISEGYPDLSEAWGIKKFIALFVASLVLRHPDTETQTREIHDDMINFIEGIPKDSQGNPKISEFHHNGTSIPFDASKYDEYKSADENRLKQAFAEQIHPLAVDLSEDLFKKRWCFLCTDAPMFISSDSPVIKQHTERRKFGIRTPGVQIWFPVSPTRMLWMNDRKEGEVDGFYPLPSSETAALNMFTLNHATRFILSHQDPDIPLLALRKFIDAQKL